MGNCVPSPLVGPSQRLRNFVGAGMGGREVADHCHCALLQRTGQKTLAVDAAAGRSCQEPGFGELETVAAGLESSNCRSPESGGHWVESSFGRREAGCRDSPPTGRRCLAGAVVGKPVRQEEKEAVLARGSSLLGKGRRRDVAQTRRLLALAPCESTRARGVGPARHQEGTRGRTGHHQSVASGQEAPPVHHMVLTAHPVRWAAREMTPVGCAKCLRATEVERGSRLADSTKVEGAAGRHCWRHAVLPSHQGDWADSVQKGR